MSLFEQLQKQRYEALKVFGNKMWGVVVHAQTYRELVAECLDGRAVFRIGDVCTTPNGDYIFGLRIIPSFGVAPNTFTIVDKRLGENILGTEAWYKADRKTEPQNYCDDCLYTDTCDSKEFFYACTSKATISKMEQVDEPQTERSE